MIDNFLLGSPQDLFARLLELVYQDGNVHTHYSYLVRLNKDVFWCLPKERQISLIRVLREASVCLRYRGYFDDDWATAKLAFELYDTRGSAIDPTGNLLFDLAISGIGSAVYAGKLEQLSMVDPQETMLKSLRLRCSNAGARATLGLFYGATGNLEDAEKNLKFAIDSNRTEERKRALVHAIVSLLCCYKGQDRLDKMSEVLELYSIELNEADPPYYEIAKKANEHLLSSMNELFAKVNKGTLRISKVTAR